MMDSGGSTYIISLSYLRAKYQDIFMEGHAAHILHRAPVIFGNCNLVILAKGISQPEGFFEVGKTLLCYLKDIFCIDIFEE